MLVPNLEAFSNDTWRIAVLLYQSALDGIVSYEIDVEIVRLAGNWINSSLLEPLVRIILRLFKQEHIAQWNIHGCHVIKLTLCLRISFKNESVDSAVGLS